MRHAPSQSATPRITKRTYQPLCFQQNHPNRRPHDAGRPASVIHPRLTAATSSKSVSYSPPQTPRNSRPQRHRLQPRAFQATLTLMKPLRRVAVLGAGTMGSRIAAHFANAGYPVDLLDIVLPGQPNRNAAALAGLDAAAKQKPVAFFTAGARALISPGNFEDDLGRVRDCDWIVEAVAENLEIKRQLWSKVAALRAPGTVASTNTSGIPLAHIAEGFDDEFRRHFLGTHFFNPPRYLHLVEIIPGAATQP